MGAVNSPDTMMKGSIFLPNFHSFPSPRHLFLFVFSGVVRRCVAFSTAMVDVQ
jgi:hypothetical protein